MRLATFNVENLLAWYRLSKDLNPAVAVADGFGTGDLRPRIADAEAKSLTGQLMRQVDADIWCLQEVESGDVLKRFRDRWLGGRDAFPHAVLIDGNDDRHIDVAVLSRFPISHLRSWQHLWDSTRNLPVFSRDCLECDIAVPGKPPLTLFVNHFKSMRGDGGDGGRRETHALRQRQAQTVRDVVSERFAPGLVGADADAQVANAHFAVLGDFNDYLGEDAQGPSAIEALVHWPAVFNVTERLAPADRWTHYWKGAPHLNLPPTYQQLDFLLLSKRLAERNPQPPVIDRAGQPGRATDYAGVRLEGIGYDRPKASDHCPLAIDLDNW
jgi:endonuclease/exonuclease/phosphatase family metal-dependent hydrolase